MKRRPVFCTVGAVVAVALLGGAWFFLAPGALGGSTNYVAIAGVSMEPRFHTGDLALVRASGDYRVGEIVAYRSQTLHTIVLHRIVGRDGDRYVFKGDNNNFLDPEHPTRSQFLGKLWLQFPGLGGKLAFLRTPLTVGLLAGLAILLLAGGTATVSRRHGRQRSDAGQASSMSVRRPRPATGATDVGLTLASVALLVFLALGALAFTRPSEGSATAAAPYTQAGTFSYSASAPAGVVYPDGRAETGDPLFLHLIERAQVRFDYRLSSTSPHALTGSASLLAEIASSNGWKRTLQLQPPTSFSGDHALLAGTLRLRSIQSLLRRFEAATAVSGSITYTLTLLPHLRVSGTLAGAHLDTTFAPRLPFSLDPLQLRPQLANDTTAASAQATAATANPLTPTTSGSVKITNRAARDLSFRSVHVPVALARRITTIGAAAALCALLACALLLLRGRRADEPARIQARYRDRLIPVARSDRRSYDEIVELTSFETLARLAERYDQMILHEQDGLEHSYRIADEGILYIYLVGNDRTLLPLPPAPTTPTSMRPQPRP